MAAALIASLALGLLLVAKKHADSDQSWPPGPQPLRIDMPRDARIAAQQPRDAVILALAGSGEIR